MAMSTGVANSPGATVNGSAAMVANSATAGSQRRLWSECGAFQAVLTDRAHCTSVMQCYNRPCLVP